MLLYTTVEAVPQVSHQNGIVMKGKKELFSWLTCMAAVAAMVVACQPKKGQAFDRAAWIGIWQDANHMASGWSDVYRLFGDGRFRFHTSQMNCAERMRSYAGTWAVAKDELVLTITERVTIEGGELVESVICASELEIEGGEEKTIALATPEIQRISVGTMEVDEGTQRSRMAMDGKKFWRMNEDPEGY